MSICGFFLVILFPAAKACAQAPTVQQPAAATAQSAAIGSYSDSTSGLEHLLKDIIKAQRENDAARAEALLKSLILPDYTHWYYENFDDGIAKLSVAAYAANVNSLTAQLARVFLDAQSKDFQRIEAVRYGKNCDDNASELTFAMLDGRLKEFPIYEGRLFKGGEFLRLFAFVYVDEGFRFLIVPKFEQVVKSEARAREESAAKRLLIGGNVQAARLLNRVQPAYPSVARDEHLSGTVKLHAVIGTDGSVESLRVLSGRCSLARASVDAVRHWRYQPTLLNGAPVEVETEIDVIFSLQR
ncbi:MAG TPA: energy transducer TonB [Candidatus Sulfotelmatobacter sp.]|nr:energy transducer TonB [Candidatus Sulfotelmatobacter sp.]